MSALVKPQLLDPTATAKILGTTPGVLAVWRCQKRHNLPYVKVGKTVMYDLQDLLDWLESRTVRPVAL
jgi:hypothetical protein